MQLTVEEFAELVRQKDRTQMFVNMERTDAQHQSAVRLDVKNYTLDQLRDPLITIERMVDGIVVGTASIRVSEVFTLWPLVRTILANKAREAGVL